MEVLGFWGGGGVGEFRAKIIWRIRVLKLSRSRIARSINKHFNLNKQTKKRNWRVESII